MIQFLKLFLNTVEKEPNRVAVVDRDGKRRTTYRQLYSCCLRVNAWMRAHGLGRESVSAIYFPKSMEYVAARLGIIMAGGAWVALDDMMGKERREFVIRDSGCQVVFDQEKWEEAMEMEECPEIADSDLHDLAFILYTSGSTGTPKGIVQEYGLYDYIVECARSFFVPHGEIVFAEVAPQTFLSGPFSSIGMFSVKGELHEISPAMARNPLALAQYFAQQKITDSFLPPTLLRSIVNYPELYLRAVCTGGENSSEIYSDRFIIANIYSASEFGYPACLFQVDKAYTNTPVGYATCGAEIVLLDEKGQPSDEGEFCIHLPYFRGYLRDNSSCFVTLNEKRFFRASDYVRLDQEGRYIVLSRLDDMVKINGNRVDTREVESVVKRVLGVDFCCVKLFINHGIRALCAYYTGDRDIDSVSAAQALHKHLPGYMIPSCYIRLDEIPLNANGKVNKRALPKPEQMIRLVPYCPPENDRQKQLCEILKSGLSLKEDVGIDDDLFALGIDSIRAMEVLSGCDIPALNVRMIYEGRTIRRITALLQETDVLPEKAEETASLAPLNTAQIYLLKWDLRYPGTCMMNLPVRIDLLPGVDMKALAAAVRTAVQAHPVLLSTIEEREGRYYLRYDAAFDREIPVEEVTPEELEEEAKRFAQPFRLDGTPVFRCRILKAGNGGAVFLDIYHVICDGMSLSRFLSDIGESFTGKTIPRDNCFSLLRKELDYRSSPRFQRDMKYFASRYDCPGWDTLPRVDHESEENWDDTLFRAFDFEPEDRDQLVKKYGLGKNGLFLAATAVSIALYNKKGNVMFTWTWHGRADSRRAQSVGLFMKDIPLAVRLKRGLRLSELYESITEQIQNGISHASVSYWEEKENYHGQELVCLLYQGDLYEQQESYGIFQAMEELPMGPTACNNTLDIEILEGSDGFGVLLDYNAKKYEKESMERFAELFCGVCSQLVRKNKSYTTVGEILHGLSLPLER